MPDERGKLLAVDTGLVLQTLVESVLPVVEGRRADRPPEGIAAVLEAQEGLTAVGSDRALDNDLRHAGYLARVIEVERFEPAQQTADWIPGMLRERLQRTGGWPEAVVDVCGELARGEPLGKPSPDDDAAKSWRVPGPGGHVRHFLARRTIEEYLAEREEPVIDDPAELKRPWLYGFFVRACEEALPPEASLDPQP